MKLSQVIAIEHSAKSHRQSVMSELYKRAQKPDLFTGFSRVYEAHDENGEQLPPEEKKVQHTVAATLAEAREALQQLFTIVAQKDWGNQAASADIVVDGAVIAAKVPVTYLLFLDKELTDIRTFVSALPSPENTENWQEDPVTDFYRTDPVSTYRTKKTQRPIVLYDATEQHPAQTQLITEDVSVGTWKVTRFSGGIALKAKAAYLTRIDKLLIAVKLAREAANMYDIPDRLPVENGILSYIFG